MMESARSSLGRVAAGLEAAILHPLFAPLERACGPLGDLVTQTWVSQAAGGEGDAFAALLRESLERDDG